MKNSTPTKSLCNDSFLSVLNQFSSSDKFWIAFSGGLDSSVLLHLFFSNKNKIKQNIEVLYVNHGLQEEAEEWGDLCEEQCNQYGFNFRLLKITETVSKGESIEAWARERRYELILGLMNTNDVLFTAHHNDDQVETFFIQALRGAGARGLASMPMIKKESDIYHVRPLLNCLQSELHYYAESNNLKWLEDKSNSDCRYDRNYFRHKLAPVIETRWPAYRQTITRLINNQKETKVLLDELASEDLKNAMHNDIKTLELDIVNRLSIERQKNLVFYWLKSLGLKSPASKNVNKIIEDIIFSDAEKSPCVNWENVEVRRYKKLLYAIKVIENHSINDQFKWSPDTVLGLLDETIVANSSEGIGLSKEKTKGHDFTICYRQGGEKIYINDLSHSKTVKQLFQERSVLPWLRDRIPLIYINDELAVIPGFCVDKHYLAEANEPSWDIQWSGYKHVIQS